MSESKIEWTEHTWNPIAGCSILTPGCTNCYAMKMAARIEAMNAPMQNYNTHGIAAYRETHYAGTTKRVKGNIVWTGKVALAPESILLAPLKRKKPTVYFVNSMGDLFHEDVSDEWIDRVFAVMALCPQHTFQVLTKRAERMQAYLKRRINGTAYRVWGEMQAMVPQDPPLPPPSRWPLPNVWLGVSTERQKEADERIPLLLDTPAAVRFISAEPLLGPIDLTAIEAPDKVEGERWTFDALTTGDYYTQHGDEGCPTSCGDGPYRDHKLDWVICGGESGSGARPMNPQWARDLRDECAASGTPFFFKQFGAWVQRDCCNVSRDHAVFNPDGSLTPNVGVNVAVGLLRSHVVMENVGKSAAGRLLDGSLHNGMPRRGE